MAHKSHRLYRSLRWLLSLLLGMTVVLVAVSSSLCADDYPQHLQTTILTAGKHRIHAELAITPEESQKGLMYRRDLGMDEGMLFIFEEASVQCFLMSNTPTPLTIAFLADDGGILSFADMKPYDDKFHCSAQPVRFVLEMHQGWFAKRGFKAGTKLGGAFF